MAFETHTQEQFDAMNDAEFDAFWAVQAEATSEADFAEFDAAFEAATRARFAA